MVTSADSQPFDIYPSERQHLIMCRECEITNASNYKRDIVFQDRLETSRRYLLNYPDCIPILFEKDRGYCTFECIHRNCNRSSCIDWKKYVVPKEITISEFHRRMRTKFDLKDDHPFYIFIWGPNYDLVYPTPPKTKKGAGGGLFPTPRKMESWRRRFPRGQLNDCTLSPGTFVSELYQSHKDEDGFLYITYGNEYPLSWSVTEQEEEQEPTFGGGSEPSFGGFAVNRSASVPMVYP